MDESEQLKAELAKMKIELEAAKLREALQESELRAERLQNENIKLRGQPKPNSEPLPPPKPSLSLLPEEVGVEETELDEAFETMLTECLREETKRDSLRDTYYNRRSTADKYYFFLEWASYLRKPEVLEQNGTKSSHVDINPGDSTGMRQRNAAGDGSRSPTTSGMEMGVPTIQRDADENKYRRPSESSKKKNLSGGLQIFFYVVLVASICGILWVFKNFLQEWVNGGVRLDHQERSDLWD